MSQEDESDVNEDAELDTANSVYHAVADRSTFSIAGVMDRSGDVPDNGEATSVVSNDDPVCCGILSVEEAESLFDQ